MGDGDGDTAQVSGPGPGGCCLLGDWLATETENYLFVYQIKQRGAMREFERFSVLGTLMHSQISLLLPCKCN